MTRRTLFHTRRAGLTAPLAAVALATGALGVAGCGESVTPTAAPSSVIRRDIPPQDAKGIPLKTPMAEVKAKLGPPQRSQNLVGEARKTKEGKAFSVPYTLWTYGVKGGIPSDSIEMTFVKGKLASVLMSIASKKGQTTPNPVVP